jgi:hypothetical protein
MIPTRRFHLQPPLSAMTARLSFFPTESSCRRPSNYRSGSGRLSNQAPILYTKLDLSDSPVSFRKMLGVIRASTWSFLGLRVSGEFTAHRFPAPTWKKARAADGLSDIKPSLVCLRNGVHPSCYYLHSSSLSVACSGDTVERCFCAYKSSLWQQYKLGH